MAYVLRPLGQLSLTNLETWTAFGILLGTSANLAVKDGKHFEVRHFFTKSSQLVPSLGDCKSARLSSQQCLF